MDYRMVTRVDKDNAGEKCPQCRFIGRSFLELSEDLWGCMDCGCTFIPRKRRLKIREDILVEQKVVVEDKKDTEEINFLKCDFIGCEFIAKTKYGLIVHKRKHVRTN